MTEAERPTARASTGLTLLFATLCLALVILHSRHVAFQARTTADSATPLEIRLAPVREWLEERESVSYVYRHGPGRPGKGERFFRTQYVVAPTVLKRRLKSDQVLCDFPSQAELEAYGRAEGWTLLHSTGDGVGLFHREGDG